MPHPSCCYFTAQLPWCAASFYGVRIRGLWFWKGQTEQAKWLLGFGLPRLVFFQTLSSGSTEPQSGAVVSTGLRSALPESGGTINLFYHCSRQIFRVSFQADAMLWQGTGQKLAAALESQAVIVERTLVGLFRHQCPAGLLRVFVTWHSKLQICCNAPLFKLGEEGWDAL